MFAGDEGNDIKSDHCTQVEVIVCTCTAIFLRVSAVGSNSNLIRIDLLLYVSLATIMFKAFFCRGTLRKEKL